MPFHNAYRSAIEDDNAEFAYLQTGEDVAMVSEEGGDMDDDTEPRDSVTVEELREQLRAAARENREGEVSASGLLNSNMFSILTFHFAGARRIQL